MTPEQQRIAIAEACGWEPLPEGHFHPDNPVGQTMPDYPFDLNAMRDAEQVLIRPSLYAKGGWGMYLRYLSIVTDEEHPIDATASQRAEAFLHTIGKWEESK